MLRSWTNRSFWTNLLGERIVLVHVIHWLIFLVHWNSSLQSSVALLALVCGLFNPVKDWLNLEPIAFEYEMWQSMWFVECSEWIRPSLTELLWTRERSRLWTSWMNWYISFVNVRTSCWTIMMAHRLSSARVVWHICSKERNLHFTIVMKTDPLLCFRLSFVVYFALWTIYLFLFTIYLQFTVQSTERVTREILRELFKVQIPQN